MRHRLIVFFGLVLIASTAATAQTPSPQGQPQFRTFRFNADSSVMIREIMTIVADEGGVLKVAMVPPAGRRPEGMPEVDLQRGDEVGMAGGKRIKTIKELREVYAASKPGEEFKLGIRRDGRPVIVTFTRKDEKEMPGGNMVIRTGPGGENSDIFPALGLMLEQKGGAVVVSETMPHASKEIQKGDAVVTLNGAAVNTVSDFAKALDATKVGEKLTFVLSRKGEKVTVSFPRPEPRGGMQIIRR
jgi:S1-C subfamily serine protease